VRGFIGGEIGGAQRTALLLEVHCFIPGAPGEQRGRNQ
jgi:hypothetical protein